MKRLDPQVDAVITRIKAELAQQPSSWRPLSADEKIAETRYMMNAFSGFGRPFEPMARVEDIDIPGPAGMIPARLYAPGTAASQGGEPVLVFYDGGGFVAGDLDSYDTLLRALAN